MRGLIALSLAALLLAACSAVGPRQTASPSASDEGVAQASPDASAEASADVGRASSLSSPDPSKTNPPPTPGPRAVATQDVPVGRAASAQGDAPAPGMVRLTGLVRNGAKEPDARVCVTLGPPIACAVLTDDAGRYVIDVPQGAISWEFHFLRSGAEIGPRVTLEGPFPHDSVQVETVTVRE